MTSFYPTVPQSLEALHATTPPGLNRIQIDWDDTQQLVALWFVVAGTSGRALKIRADAEHGVELCRYGNNDPNAVLQALANYWGCAIVSEYEDERFDPQLLEVDPAVLAAVFPEPPMGDPKPLKLERHERAVVMEAIRNQEGARRVLLMVSTPDWGTSPTTLDREQAAQLWLWLGRWLRQPT
jgi:hypothetical protein